MKVVEEYEDGSFLVKIDPLESMLVIDDDGGIESRISIDEEEEEARNSALEVAIALIALSDPLIRNQCMRKITETNV